MDSNLLYLIDIVFQYGGKSYWLLTLGGVPDDVSGIDHYDLILFESYLSFTKNIFIIKVIIIMIKNIKSIIEM